MEAPEAAAARDRQRVKSMRILVVNYEYPPLGGGASPVTRGVCVELARRGHQVDVVTMSYRGLPRHEEEGNLRVFRVPCRRSAVHLCHIREMVTWVPGATLLGMRLMRARRYDLIHAHFLLPSGVVAHLLSRATGVPYVVTAHGSDVPGFNPDRFRASHRLLAPLWRRIATGARAITCPSRWLANLISSNVSKELRIEVIPNGIAQDWVIPGPKQRQILVVTRLFERKGVQFLLQALQGDRLGYAIHIVGDGPYRPRLEAMAPHVPDPVVFHGWLDGDSSELKRIYATASIFVFPSIAENFPISLLEAMLSGAAIVASGLAACREVLGETALYAIPGDVPSIREHLVRLVNEPETRARYAAEARQRVLDRFTWPRVGDQYEGFFSALAPSPSLPPLTTSPQTHPSVP